MVSGASGEAVSVQPTGLVGFEFVGLQRVKGKPDGRNQ